LSERMTLGASTVARSGEIYFHLEKINFRLDRIYFRLDKIYFRLCGRQR